MNKKKNIKKLRDYIFWSFIIISILTGIIFYITFLSYYPGINWNDFFISKFKIKFFEFSGIIASIFVSIPVILIATEIFYKNSTNYLLVKSEKCTILVSEQTIKNFCENIVLSFNGVENTLTQVDIFKKNFIGLQIYIELSEKTDYIKLSERITERIKQDLEFNFGIKEIKFINVYIENIAHTNEQSYVLIYK